VSAEVPASAQARLEELRGMTSSFFSAASYAAQGVHALGQVVGLSACRLATGVVRRTRGHGDRSLVTARWQEYDGPVRSWTTARQRATERLLAQAKQLGAHAVLGVEARHERDDSGAEPVVEVILTGTAVRLDEPIAKAPVAALVTPQELVRLRAAGTVPVGIAGGFSSVFVTAGRDTFNAMAPWRRAGNVELEDYTLGVYEARRLALQRLSASAASLGAHGVIGVDLSDLGHHRVESVMGWQVHAWGTAVKRTRGDAPRPKGVLAL
jgi:uncharacterized protein YbjQ (UPF0145 family)